MSKIILLTILVLIPIVTEVSKNHYLIEKAHLKFETYSKQYQKLIFSNF